MAMLLRVCLIAAVLLSYALLSCASELEKRNDKESQSNDKHAHGNIKLKRSNTTAHEARSKSVTQTKKVKKTGSERISMGSRRDMSCIRLGGICQPAQYVCPGQYSKDKCSGTKTRQCCMPVGAWSVFCSGHHNNRVRGCDAHGCGAFKSKRGDGLHKAVDLVCDDYGTVNAPFSGTLAGPVHRKDQEGNQYDGVKFLSDVHCVKIYNIRPYRYIGPVAQGQALGYLLPLQERFSGITSHLELQLCDGTDPTPFI